MPARGRRRPTPLTKTQGQRWKAASGSLEHLQWLCPHGVHLHPLGSRSLITVCHYGMTACPTTAQGSHHQTPKHPGSAVPSQTAAPTWNHADIRKGETGGGREERKTCRRLSCCPCRKRTPCSANPALFWRVGLGGSKASLRSILGLSMAAALTATLHPRHKEFHSNGLGLASPATAHPRKLSRGTQTAHWKNRSQAWKPVAS